MQVTRPVPVPDGIWSAWSWEPSVLLAVGVAGIAYTIGLRRLGMTGHRIARGRVTAFAVGLLVLFLALVSPIDALGEALFAGHMVQHLLLILVVAPLVVAGDAALVLLVALPRVVRRRLAATRRRRQAMRGVARAFDRPAVVWPVNAAVLWFWHLPVTYGWALEYDLVHAIEHASFLLASMTWWRLLYRASGPQLDRGAGILFVFTTGAQMSALGALLTFAAAPWYPGHAPWTAAWGLTPLADQQIAGLIMWLPAGFVYQAVAVVMLLQWLDRSRRLQPAHPLQGVRAQK